MDKPPKTEKTVIDPTFQAKVISEAAASRIPQVISNMPDARIHSLSGIKAACWINSLRTEKIRTLPLMVNRVFNVSAAACSNVSKKFPDGGTGTEVMETEGTAASFLRRMKHMQRQARKDPDRAAAHMSGPRVMSSSIPMAA